MLLETICIKNQTAQNLAFHQARFDDARKEIFGLNNKIDLAQHLLIPDDNGVYKCRLIYGEAIQTVELVSYTMRSIQSLQVVIANDLKYNVKYADRSALAQLVAQKNDADDILIVKNAWITDTSYSNIVCWDGKTWWTPDTPLLKGTRRAKYLKEGRIQERAIGIEDLKKYKGVKLINAMMGLEDTAMIPISKIMF